MQVEAAVPWSKNPTGSTRHLPATAPELCPLLVGAKFAAIASSREGLPIFPALQSSWDNHMGRTPAEAGFLLTRCSEARRLPVSLARDAGCWLAPRRLCPRRGSCSGCFKSPCPRIFWVAEVWQCRMTLVWVCCRSCRWSAHRF